MMLETVFFSRSLAGAFLQGIVVELGGAPTCPRSADTSSKASASMEFDAAVSSHSHQASWSEVTILQSHMSLSFRVICHSVLTHRGSKPTNCSCESSWAGPCWDMEPGLGDWPAKLRKLVSVSGGLLPHQLLREITVTLRTLRSKSASGLTSKPRL